jgi:glycosyltransferase involved in cell wall biosynthesis
MVGDAPQDHSDLPIALVGGLRYDSLRVDGSSLPPIPAEQRKTAGKELALAMRAAMEERWGGLADIVHVHNPLIRKNSILLEALRCLRESGIKLLLQNHDFAEDFRPDVYLMDEAYPEDCHYATINSRDFSFLHRSGLELSGLHLLPNAVAPIEPVEALERTRFLYPVRAIGRKNIGEALLLSLFLPQGCTVAVTLPPNSRRDEGTYRRLRSLADELRLPMEFEVGSGSTLKELLGSSRCSITTSVKEGFGFSFLEPWTADRPVVGRRIDYVCRDFEQAGVRFDSMYSSLDIPLVYLSPPILRKKMERALVSAFVAYGASMPPYLLKMLTDDVFSRDTFDFGRLDEELQGDVLRMVASNDAARADLADANPFLADLASWQEDEALTAANKSAILAAYSDEAALRRLRDCYRAVMEKPVRHRLSKAILLELFLNPLELSLVGMGHD